MRLIHCAWTQKYDRDDDIKNGAGNPNVTNGARLGEYNAKSPAVRRSRPAHKVGRGRFANCSRERRVW